MPHQSTTFPASLTGKLLYTIYAISITLLTLPYHLLIYILPFLRPHSEWTYHQSIMNHLMRAFLFHASILELQTPLPLAPGPEGPQNFAAIPAAHESHFRGVLTPTTEIEPCAMGGVWYPSPFNPTTDTSPSSIVFLYFHGGAFTIGTAAPSVCAFAATTLTTAFPASKTLAFSYRLASAGPACAFPAALQDSLSAYLYLLLGCSVPADRIVFAADSAGCALTIGLLRYLAAPQHRLPEPRAAILCSPWVDIDAARRLPRQDFCARFHATHTDYLPAELQLWGARTYVPASDRTTPETGVYVSPGGHPFATGARIFVIIGNGEVLAREGAEWAEEMGRVDGGKGKVRVEVVRGANHAVLGVGGIMGWKKEAERAVRSGSEWVLGRE